MSGTNPFRRRIDQSSPKAGNAAVNTGLPDRTEARIPPIDTDVQRPPKTKTGKTVRIISPHSAISDHDTGLPQSFYPSSDRTTSPPPQGAQSSESSDDEPPENPFSAGSDGTAGSKEDERTQHNTQINSGTSQAQRSGPPKLPGNPFKRTLASQDTESNPSPTDPGRERRIPRVESSTARPHYDVDDFKRLLLTGEKTIPGASAPAAPSVSFQGQHSIGDSSSNTDTSSISRQSIFEPIAGPLQESPRTSPEVSPSEDDRQQLVGGQPPILQKSKPSTPRHRHGKLVKVNAPQTVSFEDPSLSFSSSHVIPQSPGTSGDIDKPLPPLPHPSDKLRGPILATQSTESNPLSVSAYVPSSPTSQKRDPPAPPLSRRHSQLKPKPVASSERAILLSEEAMTETGALSQSPPMTFSKAPPPPPPRRAGVADRVDSSSSGSKKGSTPQTQSQSSTDDISISPSKPRPPALSNHSPTSLATNRQTSQPLPGSPATAPPPPPSRRRGSSQSSYTPSRMSGDYRIPANQRLRSDSGASSNSHLQMTPMTATPSSTESKDVMADLSALQREVDELRRKFRD